MSEQHRWGFEMSEQHRCIMGIDPGVTGGIAFLWSDTILVIDIPSVDGEVDIDQLVDEIRLANPCAAIIERASARPGQGVSSTFKYGQAYGALRACCAVLNIPQHLVSPAKWKKHFGLDKDKEKSRALAIRYWPGMRCFGRKKDHGRAESALIAKYGLEKVLVALPSMKAECAGGTRAVIAGSANSISEDERSG